MTVMLLALFANAAPLERDAYVMRVGTDEAVSYTHLRAHET